MHPQTYVCNLAWALSVLDALIDSHVSFLPFIFTILLSAQTCEKKCTFLEVSLMPKKAINNHLLNKQYGLKKEKLLQLGPRGPEHSSTRL